MFENEETCNSPEVKVLNLQNLSMSMVGTEK